MVNACWSPWLGPCRDLWLQYMYFVKLDAGLPYCGIGTETSGYHKSLPPMLAGFSCHDLQPVSPGVCDMSLCRLLDSGGDFSVFVTLA